MYVAVYMVLSSLQGRGLEAAAVTAFMISLVQFSEYSHLLFKGWQCCVFNSSYMSLCCFDVCWLDQVTGMIAVVIRGWSVGHTS